MNAATMTAALTPTIKASLASAFAAELAGSPQAFGAKLDKLAAALASGIAAGLVPYLQTQAQVTDPAGAVIGKVQ